MRSEYRRFGILTSGRTGSNLLGGALGSHPQILWFNEVLDPEGYSRDGMNKVDPIRERRIAEGETSAGYLEHAVFVRWSRELRAVGVKLKYEYLAGNDLAEHLRATRMHLIHLLRNPLATSLSGQLSKLNRRWVDYQGAAGYRPIRIDVELLERAVQGDIDDVARYRRFFGRTNPIIEVTYEDLRRTSPTNVLVNRRETDRILDFLGAERAAVATPFHRQRLAPYRQLATNFDDLERFIRVRRPEWGTYFEQLEG